MGVSPNQLSSREGLGIFLSPALPRTKKHFQDFGNTFWYTKMHVLNVKSHLPTLLSASQKDFAQGGMSMYIASQLM